MSSILHYDDRTISQAVFTSLQALSQETTDETARKEQKNQAVELYTYLATWGLLRLQGEIRALSKTTHKQTVQCFFETLGRLVDPEFAANPEVNPFRALETGVTYLTGRSASEYLGLTGFAMQVAREFSFWAEAIYADV